jgi:hypothetical protein
MIVLTCLQIILGIVRKLFSRIVTFYPECFQMYLLIVNADIVQGGRPLRIVGGSLEMYEFQLRSKYSPSHISLSIRYTILGMHQIPAAHGVNPCPYQSPRLTSSSDGPNAWNCGLPGFHCSVTNIMNKASFITSKAQPGAW